MPLFRVGQQVRYKPVGGMICDTTLFSLEMANSLFDPLLAFCSKHNICERS